MKKSFIILFLIPISCNNHKSNFNNNISLQSSNLNKSDILTKNIDTFFMDSLSTFIVDKNWPIKVHYSPDISYIINRKMTDEPFSYIRVLKTKIEKSSNNFYYINYSEDPSADPTFFIYKLTNDTLMSIGELPGLEIYLPGNGYVYISGHADNMFNIRKIYHLDNDKLIEVKQPYYFVGIKLILEGNINIYSDTNYSNMIISLKKGTAISVLINKNIHYLIKTPFGLVGWIKVNNDTVPGYPIREIYYKGD